MKVILVKPLDPEIHDDNTNFNAVFSVGCIFNAEDEENNSWNLKVDNKVFGYGNVFNVFSEEKKFFKVIE